jgi:hypothetical protein
MEYPKNGDEVLIKGIIVNTYHCQDGVDPTLQSVTVQTPDGQGIQTNLRNLVYPTRQTSADPPKPPEPPRQTENKGRR